MLDRNVRMTCFMRKSSTLGSEQDTIQAFNEVNNVTLGVSGDDIWNTVTSLNGRYKFFHDPLDS